MSEKLDRAVARLVSTSPVMINISRGVPLNSLLRCLHDGCLRRGPSRPGGGKKTILTPKRATCVVFSLLPSSSGSFSFSSSNQRQTATDSLRSSFGLDHPPLPTLKRPNIHRFGPLNYDGCACSSKGLLSLAAPGFCC